MFQQEGLCTGQNKIKVRLCLKGETMLLYSHASLSLHYIYLHCAIGFVQITNKSSESESEQYAQTIQSTTQHTQSLNYCCTQLAYSVTYIMKSHTAN